MLPLLQPASACPHPDPLPRGERETDRGVPASRQPRHNALVSTAHLRLHGDLADFTRASTGVLETGREPASVTAHFSGAPALKDVIESIGVPHPEIDLVLVDGRAASLDAAMHEGAHLEVFPAGAGPPGHVRLLPPPQDVPRFVLDGHLGRLMSLLRMLGFDSTWERDPTDEALAEISAREDRTLLTRDLGLLKRSLVRRGAFVRSTLHLAQGREVVERFALRGKEKPFSRCLNCNGSLREAPDAATRVPPRVLERHDHFFVCQSCDRIYWAGTHHERMKDVIADLLGAASP